MNIGGSVTKIKREYPKESIRIAIKIRYEIKILKEERLMSNAIPTERIIETKGSKKKNESPY